MSHHRNPVRRPVRAAFLGMIAVVLLAGCSSTVVTPEPGSTATAPPGGPPLGDAVLKYRLLDEFGGIVFCDPDFFPVARDDESALARAALPGIEADAPTYAAISAHLALDPAATPGPDTILRIYREWKRLNAIVFEDDTDGRHFLFLAADGPGATTGRLTAGMIAPDGAITVQSRGIESEAPNCPICLVRGTRIATPAGPVAVDRLRVGDPVWTRDGAGARVAATVRAVGRTPVGPTHRVIDVRLADGRRVTASPGHPLPDGRDVAVLRPGDLVDGSAVVAVHVARYDGGATYDLLPDGPTGVYWAGGIPLASTLADPDRP